MFVPPHCLKIVIQWLFAIFPPLMTLHRYAIFCFDEISFPWLTYTETNKFWIKKQIYKWMKSTYDDVKARTVS